MIQILGQEFYNPETERYYDPETGVELWAPGLKLDNCLRSQVAQGYRLRDSYERCNCGEEIPGGCASNKSGYIEPDHILTPCMKNVFSARYLDTKERPPVWKPVPPGEWTKRILFSTCFLDLVDAVKKFGKRRIRIDDDLYCPTVEEEICILDQVIKTGKYADLSKAYNFCGASDIFPSWLPQDAIIESIQKTSHPLYNILQNYDYLYGGKPVIIPVSPTPVTYTPVTQMPTSPPATTEAKTEIPILPLVIAAALYLLLRK